MLREGTVTAELGSAFQLSTTLIEKHFFLTLGLALCLKSFREWPRVCVYVDIVNSFFLFQSYLYREVFYKLVLSLLPLSLLYCRVGRPNSPSLVSYGRSFSDLTSLVSRL